MVSRVTVQEQFPNIPTAYAQQQPQIHDPLTYMPVESLARSRGIVFLVLDSSLLIRSDRRLEMIQRLQFQVLASHDVFAEPVRQRFGELVVHVGACRDSEDVIEFLERALLGLGHPEEDHDESGDVEEGVESKGTLWSEGFQHLRERDGESARPEETGRHRPGHADFTMGEWEDLGRVREWNGSFAGRIECREQEDEEGNHAEMSSSVLRDPEAKTRGE